MANVENKQGVWDMVVETAKKGIAVGVNPDLSEERKAAHVATCKKAVELKEKNADIANYLILVFLVSQGAGKWDEYRNGYAKRIKGGEIVPKCFESRFKAVVEWYRLYNKANIGGGSLDVVARVMLGFYSKCEKTKSGAVNWVKANAAFRNALKAAAELGKFKGANSHGDAKAMLKNLGVELDKVKATDVEAA